jgi:hypothetical protein
MGGRRWRTTAIAAGLLAATAAPAAVLRIDDGVGDAGATLEIAVTLAAGGDALAGLQNDLEVAPPLQWVPGSCVVNPGIDKGNTSFSYGPCFDSSEAGCGRVRAIVLAFDNVDPIADGAELYRCRLAIAGDAAPGAYGIRGTNALGSDAEGNEVRLAPLGGRLAVGDVATALLRVESRSLRLAEFTPVGVRLVDAAGAQLIAVDLVLNQAFHVTSGVAQEPHCTALLSDATTSFEYRPAGCSPDDGTCVT